MRHAILSALLAPALLLAGQAQAADLPRRTAPVDDSYGAPSAAHSWRGFYIGLNAGYGFSSFDNNASDLFGSPNGGLIGVTGGYNFALASNFLLGLEADFAFAGMKGSRAPWAGLAGRSGVDDILTVRGRAGVTLDRALLFVTGGFAGSNNTIAVANAFTNFYGQQSKYQGGWTLGGGLEYALTGNISAKAEYLFTSVGGDHYFDFSPNVLESSVNTSLVRGGLNYHF